MLDVVALFPKGAQQPPQHPPFERNRKRRQGEKQQQGPAGQMELFVYKEEGQQQREQDGGSGTVLEKTKKTTGAAGRDTGADDQKSKNSSKDWKQHSQKLKFTYKEQREYETIDDDIAALEEKLSSIERQIEANATNSVKLRELLAEQEETQAALDEKTERWVYLNELAEKIAEQG